MSEEKQKKRKELIEQGLNPYPTHFKRTADALSVVQGQLKKDSVYSLSGRLMRLRSMGKAVFFNIQDSTGLCQCYMKTQELPQTDQTFFKYADIGDIIGVSGKCFQTKKGENTIRVQSFQILCKSTQMLPEKYHGLEDKELRYRYRHLDLIMSPDVRNILFTRSRVIQLIRDFLGKRGFIEVDTPALQPIYGGAMACPFSTYHNSLDARFYLKISPELYLKRLIAGGVEKVFEIGKNFRNEGMDRLHNPEFTMLEYYEAYTDYQDQMKRFEELIAYVVQSVKGNLKFNYQNKELNFEPPWERLSVFKGIQKYGGFSASSMTSSELAQKLQSLNVSVHPKDSFGKMVMTAFETLVEKHIWHPTFIVDFPKDISPLTKDHRTQKGLVERFEPFTAGMEIGNAYTELNDPVEQKARLEDQQRIQDEEKHPMDEDFLHAVGVGMPPLGGVGLGIERLVMLLTDQTSIREVIWFPTVKVKKSSSKE